LKAIKRAEEGEGVLPVARKLGISRKLLHDWIKAWKAHGPEWLNRKRGPKPGPRKLKPLQAELSALTQASAAEAKIRAADRLECEAWNPVMWAGGPAMPSPGDPRPIRRSARRSMAGSFDLLEAKCNRCGRISLVPLRALKQPLD
jgi:transposase-like protein